MCPRRVVVAVHLGRDVHVMPTSFGQLLSEVFRRVSLGRHHVMVGVANDVVGGHIGGAVSADRIHVATKPDRTAIGADDHTLRGVERPPVVAGKPRHVRRVGDDEHLDALSVHRRASLRQTLGELFPAEVECGFAHSRKLAVKPRICEAWAPDSGIGAAQNWVGS